MCARAAIRSALLALPLAACTLLNSLDEYGSEGPDASSDDAQIDGQTAATPDARADAGAGRDGARDAAVDADAEPEITCPAPANANRVQLYGKWMTQNESTGALQRSGFVGSMVVTLLSTDNRPPPPPPSALLSVVENGGSPQSLNFNEGENGDLGGNFGVAVPKVDLAVAHRAFVCVYR